MAAGTQAIGSNISEVTAAAGETGQSANQVLSAVQELARQPGQVGSEVDRFLGGIRAA